MENRPFISVVMPVYNVEKYLEKAVSSVMEQSQQDFEIILVDDCSPDKCPEICENLRQKYSKIQVIHHQKNKGLSEARNSGLEIARGKYIWFMDSDDYVENGLFEEAYRSVEENPAKVILFGLTEDYYTEQERLHHSVQIKENSHNYSNAEELRKYVITLEQKTLYGYAWNKFYDLDYLKSIQLRYEKVTLIEDILFNVNYFMDIDSMNVLDYCGYHYNKRMDNSLTSKFVPDYYELHHKRIELIYNQYQYWKLCTDDIKGVLAALYTRYIFSALQRNCDKRAKLTYEGRKSWVRKLYKDKLFEELIPYGKTDAKLLKILLIILQKKQMAAVLIMGRCIFICKEKLPMIFSVAKQKR
ncbi:MAG: glycosyltransferase family 2 protein [Bariatricus sp.]|nr:glycosyltransferase family 2 protein [Bariatricus sp.]